jgi:hypothetical protein
VNDSDGYRVRVGTKLVTLKESQVRRLADEYQRRLALRRRSVGITKQRKFR